MIPEEVLAKKTAYLDTVCSMFLKKFEGTEKEQDKGCERSVRLKKSTGKEQYLKAMCLKKLLESLIRKPVDFLSLLELHGLCIYLVC